MTFDSGFYSSFEGLKLLYKLKFDPQTWINKDIIFMFYENASLPLGPKNFLEAFSNKDSQFTGGYITFAFNYMQKEETFYKMQLSTNGINGNQVNSDFLMVLTDNYLNNKL